MSTAQPVMPNAINPKYQRAIEKAYKAIRKYHDIGNNGGDGTRKAERAYDRFAELYGELPKREQAKLQRFHKLAHGYEA